MSLFGPNVKRLKKKGDVNGLIKTLVHNRDVGQAASVALVEIGDPAVPNIIDALAQPDNNLRIKAVKILGKIASIQAKEALINSLEDEDSEVRVEAVQALGPFQDEKLTGHLVQALEDSDWRVRNEAAMALEELLWEPASEKDRVYFYIAKEMWTELELLGELAVEPLIEALDLNYVHNDAAITLGKIGDTKAISPLIRMLGKEVELSVGFFANSGFAGRMMIVAAQALFLIGEPAIAPLIQALGSEHKPTSAGAAFTLSGIGERAITHLTQALEDDNQLIRESSAELLEKITSGGDS